MAPEQVEGKEVTGAADIYALGVVLYEMVTGRLPFVGDTPLSTAVMRLREDPVTPCAHVTGLDPRWERTILRCLRRDPAERPHGAREVSEMLLGRPQPRGKWPFVAGALALGAAALIALLVAMRREAPAAAPVVAGPAPQGDAAAQQGGRRAVAVMGFKNLTGRAEADWIGGALVEMVATELSAGADVRVISGESVARAKRELSLDDEVSFAPDTLAKLRATLDADHVLTGSYMALGKEAGGRVRLDLKLVDTATGDVAAVLSQTGAEADLVELVAKTGETLRARLSLGALSAAEREGARAAQPRADAARLYAEGLAHLRVAACSAARAPLEQAVATDPNYPLARSALAEALACLGHDDRALAEARKAAELAANLPEHIRFATEAQLYVLSKQPEKALERYEQLFKRFPDNFDYGYQLAQLQLGLLREKELVETLAALRRLPPPASENPRIDLLDAYSFILAGRLDDGLARIQAARSRAEKLGLRLVAADAQLVEGRVLTQLERPEEALAVIQQARAVYEAANDLDGITKTLSIEASVREGQGDREAVLAAEQRVQSIARNLDNPRQMLQFKLLLGLRLASGSKIEGALRAFDDASEIAERVGDRDVRAFVAIMSSSMLLIHGDLAAAEHKLLDVATDPLQNETKLNVHATQAMVAALRDDAAEVERLLAAAEAVASKTGRLQVSVFRAYLFNDDEKFADGEKLAREIIASSAALSALGRFALAEALVGQRRHAEAMKVLEELDKNQLRGQFGGELRIATLRAQARSDVAEARRELADVSLRAIQQGAKLISIEARRALGMLETERGDRQQGKVILAQVVRDAEALGLRRIARKARAHL
jgi:TolB-like protein